VDQRPQNIKTKIEAILPVLRQNIERGNAVLSVSDNSIRIRNLPINKDAP